MIDVFFAESKYSNVKYWNTHIKSIDPLPVLVFEN